jgi:hypothetical protein
MNCTIFLFVCSVLFAAFPGIEMLSGIAPTGGSSVDQMAGKVLIEKKKLSAPNPWRFSPGSQEFLYTNYLRFTTNFIFGTILV